MLIRGDDSFSFEEELCDRLDWTIDEEEDEDDLEYDIPTGNESRDIKMNYRILAVERKNNKLIGKIINLENIKTYRDLVSFIKEQYTPSNLCYGIVYDKDAVLPQDGSDVFVGSDSKREYFIYNIERGDAYVMYKDSNREVEKIEII